jgi:uncharacterized protein YndB with AHSA1/START domain
MDIIDRPPLSLEFSRRFDAPPERVFDAWVTPEWAEWLGPQEARCASVELDARVGGRYHVRMTMSDGREVEVSGIYQEFSRPRKLVLTWLGSYLGYETLVTVTFSPDGAGTMMTLRHDGFRDAARREGSENGWGGPGGCFDKLAQHLARKIA